MANQFFLSGLMKPRHWVLIAILGGFGGCNLYGFLSGLGTDVYHGQVVDEETGVLLAGTVVAVIWGNSSYLGLEPGVREFLNAQETVTDSDGNFTLPVSAGLNRQLFTLVSDPWIVMYQPGYEPLMEKHFKRQGFETNDALVVALKGGVTVKLRKLRKEEIRKYVDTTGVVWPIDTPIERIPNLMRAINMQRKVAGFPPLIP
jgi:hypothetical protein